MEMGMKKTNEIDKFREWLGEFAVIIAHLALFVIVHLLLTPVFERLFPRDGWIIKLLELGTRVTFSILYLRMVWLEVAHIFRSAKASNVVRKSKTLSRKIKKAGHQ
jgi:hypothetical protein